MMPMCVAHEARGRARPAERLLEQRDWLPPPPFRCCAQVVMYQALTLPIGVRERGRLACGISSLIPCWKFSAFLPGWLCRPVA